MMEGIAGLIAIMFVFAFVAGILGIWEFSQTGDKETLQIGILMTVIGGVGVLPITFMMICVVITWFQERR